MTIARILAASVLCCGGGFGLGLVASRLGCEPVGIGAAVLLGMMVCGRLASPLLD